MHNKKQQQIKTYLLYSVLFSVTALIVFAPFLVTGTGFVGKTDGIYQHYNALMYYGEWLRSIVASIFSPQGLSVPLWDYSLGYGLDVITTLNYYVIGDPLTLTSFFVPARYTEYLYCCLILLRLFLAGLFFVLFCQKRSLNPYGSIAGALVYVFCGWSLSEGGIVHPFFANPLIYLPLILLGFEKVINKESPVLFILITAIAAMSNFYFFYMLTLALLFYAVFRFFTFYSSPTPLLFGKLFLRSVAFWLIGVLIACILFLPVVIAFLSSARSGEVVAYPLHYALSYYQDLIAAFITPTLGASYTRLGFTAPALVAFFALFVMDKKYTALKVALIVLTIFLLLPAVGGALNGFSYIANRWSFAYSFAFAFVFTNVWAELFELNARQKIFLGCSALFYIILLFIADCTNHSVLISIVLLLVTLLMVVFKTGFAKLSLRPVFYTLFTFLIIVGIGSNAFFKYMPNEDNYLSIFLPFDTAYATMNKTSTSLFSQLSASKDLYNRVDSAEDSVRNTSMHFDIPSTHFYWSLINAPITNFLEDVGLSNMKQSFSCRNLESRTMLEALLNVKYFIGEEDSAPFGFAHDSDLPEGHNKVFVNKYTLPIGYSFESAISQSEWEELSPSQRQEAALYSAVVPDEYLSDLPMPFENNNIKYSQVDIDYDLELDDNVTLSGDNTFIVGKKNAEVTLRFSGLQDCETYLQFCGLEIQDISKLDLYFDDDETMFTQDDYYSLPLDKQNKLVFDASSWGNAPSGSYSLIVRGAEKEQTIAASSSSYKWHHGNGDYLVNMGYRKNAQSEMTIVFPRIGVYSFEELSVICQPFANYEAVLSNLTDTVLSNAYLGVNTLQGEIALDKSKIISLPMPYSKGWMAYVDNEEVSVIQNGMFCSVLVSPGTHELKMQYETPGLKFGIALSIIGWLMLTAVCLYRRVKS